MGCFDQHNVLTDDFDYILNSELKVEQFKNQNFLLQVLQDLLAL